MGLIDFSGQQLATIRRTVAKDTNDTEFDLFMNATRGYGLDPFRKQISAIVFNKTKADKRQMAIIVNRDGLRTIAQRCGDYRPAADPAEYVVDDSLKSATNPHGIVSVVVKLWKQDKSDNWYPVAGEAYWDEFAPISKKWEYDQSQGKRVPTDQEELGSTWAKMPRLMIAKCAEAQALRAGWPDQFSGLYVEEEMEAAQMRDITPSDAVREEEEASRQALLGNRSILFSFNANTGFERVPVGQVADRCLEFIKDSDAETIYTWSVQNREPLRDFWAASPDDALAVKKQIEAKTKNFDPTKEAA